MLLDSAQLGLLRHDLVLQRDDIEVQIKDRAAELIESDRDRAVDLAELELDPIEPLVHLHADVFELITHLDELIEDLFLRARDRGAPKGLSELDRTEDHISESRDRVCWTAGRDPDREGRRAAGVLDPRGDARDGVVGLELRASERLGLGRECLDRRIGALEQDHCVGIDNRAVLRDLSEACLIFLNEPIHLCRIVGIEDVLIDRFLHAQHAVELVDPLLCFQCDVREGTVQICPCCG